MSKTIFRWKRMQVVLALAVMVLVLSRSASARLALTAGCKLNWYYEWRA